MTYSERYISLNQLESRELMSAGKNKYCWYETDYFKDEDRDYNEYSFFNDTLYMKTDEGIEETGYTLCNNVLYDRTDLAYIIKAYADSSFQLKLDTCEHTEPYEFRTNGTWSYILSSGVYRIQGSYIILLNTSSNSMSYFWVHEDKAYEDFWVCSEIHKDIVMINWQAELNARKQHSDREI